ncbi:MAG: hypothetical protein AVDCRST_MAG88-2715 [uncultured Thermomicrobiales bacterium]|uniref:Uncharacterized protein n=1 Tax=uncultured Thermomicrobiales bacterium TaxID=1645740 RepID=A0A6J4VBK1_9BACT|nr:MAG: hypothetical protein AVDCRST_MAG88-2715 [uncultured Thermomicrobiales bacterium]
MRNVPASHPGLTFHDVVYRPSVAPSTAQSDAAPWRYQLIVARRPDGEIVLLVGDRLDNLGEGLDALARELSGEVVRRYCGDQWPRLWIEDDAERPFAERFRVVDFRVRPDNTRAPYARRPIAHDAIVQLLGGPFLAATEGEALARDRIIFGTIAAPPVSGWDWQRAHAHHPERPTPAGLLDDPVRIWRWRLEYALRRWRRAAMAHDADPDSAGSWRDHERVIRASGPALRSLETVEDLITHYFCHRFDHTWLDRPGDSAWTLLTLGANRAPELLEGWVLAAAHGLPPEQLKVLRVDRVADVALWRRFTALAARGSATIKGSGGNGSVGSP